MKVLLSFVLFFLFLCGDICAQNSIETYIEKLQKKKIYKNATIGASIIDLETGEIIYNQNSERLIIPASVMKIVTSAAALEVLGPDYQFITNIGYIGNIKNGKLVGDLVIIGGGDPALGSDYFYNNYFNPHFIDKWSKEVKKRGINRVEGEIILDGSIYSSEKIPSTWIWKDIGNYYGAGANAFTIYDNLIKISFKSPNNIGSRAKIININPNIEEMVWVNEVLASDDNRDLAYVYGSPYDILRIIRGTIPKNKKCFTIKAANHFPEKIFVNDFIISLNKNGVDITKKIKTEKIEATNYNSIYIQKSPSLSEIIKVLNHESVNLFAEHLVKQLGVTCRKIGDREIGIEVIKNYWSTKGLNVDQLILEDGSGLSHFNAVSPSFITSILLYMDNSQNRVSFRESLPNAGVGTVANFSKEKFPGKTLQIKSGSMKRVKCYAGYINKERKMAFAFMVNNYNGNSREIEEDLQNLIELL